jgi:3-oxoadipate enol-lactonase
MTDEGTGGIRRPKRLQIEREGTVLQAELHGLEECRLVAFTHGGWMDRRMFDGQIHPVATAGYQVLTWDLRGHGESLLRGIARPSVADMTADLIAVLDDTGHTGPVFLVGQTLGGMISQHLALVTPERVAGLVTIGSPCINPDDLKLAHRMAWMWRVSGFVNGLLPTSLILRQMVR